MKFKRSLRVYVIAFPGKNVFAPIYFRKQFLALGRFDRSLTYLYEGASSWVLFSRIL